MVQQLLGHSGIYSNWDWVFEDDESRLKNKIFKIDPRYVDAISRRDEDNLEFGKVLSLIDRHLENEAKEVAE